MTDNEIIRALECCVKATKHSECSECGCPALVEGTCLYEIRSDFPAYDEDVFKEQMIDVLDVINRQKAEIDRLKNLNIKLDEYIVRARAEAIKEFAERLKAEMIKSRYSLNVSPYARACNAVVDFWVDEIDNLVKEFTEEP